MQYGPLRLILVLILLLGVLGIAEAAPAKLINSRLSATAQLTRVVFDFTRPVKYKLFTLKNPDRVVLDLQNTWQATSFTKLKLAATSIQSIRSNPKDVNALRIVFDLKKKARAKVLWLKPSGKSGNRLVVDLESVQSPTKASRVHQPDLSKALPSTRDAIVVIDPGHGGKDPGATSINGVREKNVVLAIAKKLAARINRTPGMKARLTRKGDYFISLRKRLILARKYKADLFIAIHADAFKNPRASGASVYALSRRGASSEAARWLANKENYSELLGGANLDVGDNMLRSVLLNLSQNATIAASLKFGNAVLNRMRKISKLHQNKVEQARFVVLKSPDIPSLLIETGFLSNPMEATLLKTSRYQNEMAVAILGGLKAYLTASPPPGTWFAVRRGETEYRVARGDTLSEIAEKFDVTVKALRQMNRLSGSQIKLGQNLRIPN